MPARTPAREALVLVALVIILVAVVAYQMQDTGLSGASGHAAQARPASSSVAAARDRAAAVPEVRLSALHALATAAGPTTSRNPFVERPNAPVAPVPASRPAPDREGPPPLPMITLKLVAIVQGAGRPIAALSDGRDVFYGREGEVVEGRYKIIKINVESIDISYVDGRGQRRLGLTG